MNYRHLLLPLVASALSFMNPVSALSSPNLLGVAVRDIEGKETTLKSFAGKVLLVVNVASECGYTRQYEGLEALHRKYKNQGLLVLGFPCNDFGNQEPGDEKQIQAFCSREFKVSFPMFSKVSIRGGSPHPLFAQLTGSSSPFPGPVEWNFQKFLIGKDGTLRSRFASGIEPDAPELVQAIEQALKAR